MDVLTWKTENWTVPGLAEASDLASVCEKRHRTLIQRVRFSFDDLLGLTVALPAAEGRRIKPGSTSGKSCLAQPC